jgi:nucleotidyltransferase/DNA polymerase involved in DNA repair
LAADGVTTVGALAALPVDTAVALLGRGGGTLVRMAAGRGEGPPPPTTVARRLCRQRVFEAPPASIEDEVVPLVAEVSSALRRLGVGASTLGLRVEHADGRSRTHAVPLPRPTSDEATLAHTARRLLARALAPVLHVRLVSVSASGLVPGSRQGELFDGQPAGGDRRQDPLADRRGWDRRAWPRLAG